MQNGDIDDWQKALGDSPDVPNLAKIDRVFT